MKYIIASEDCSEKAFRRITRASAPLELKIINDHWTENKNNGPAGGAHVTERVFGDTPIIISAPHAVNHSRKGKTKPQDVYTGGLSYILARSLRCTLLTSEQFAEGQDGNHSPIEQCIYKQKLLKTVAERKIALVLDIHGSRDAAGFDLCIGTAPRGHNPISELDKSAHEALVELFPDRQVELNPEGYSAIGEDKSTITDAIRTHTAGKVCAYQIELARHMRVPGEHSFEVIQQMILFAKKLALQG